MVGRRATKKISQPARSAFVHRREIISTSIRMIAPRKYARSSGFEKSKGRG